MAKKGEKIIKDSNKIAKLMGQIEQVFDYAFNHGITLDLKKEKQIDEKTGEEVEVEVASRWSESTKNVYKDMVQAFVRDINKEYNASTVSKISGHAEDFFQKRIDKFHEGDLSESYNLKTLTAAIAAFNHATKESSVFKKSFELGDADKYRTMMKDQYVIRYSKSSTTLRATPDQAQTVLDNIKNSGYDTKMRETAYHVGKISMLTGGRISPILKLTAGDFIIDKKTNEVHFLGDKGGKDNSVRVGKDTVEYLQTLKDGKNDNERIFSSIRTQGEGKGTFMSTKELRKSVTRIISKAGSHLNTTKEITVRDKDGKPVQRTVVQKFTPHSFRKSFAMDRVGYYVGKFGSQKDLDKYVSNRIAADLKLKEKLDTLRERLNKHRNESRELTAAEYAVFFTSVDLGHYRNDVITAFYTTFKEVMKYIEEKE